MYDSDLQVKLNLELAKLAFSLSDTLAGRADQTVRDKLVTMARNYVKAAIKEYDREV